MKLNIIIILVIIFQLFHSLIYADTIIIAADQWCPYNCEPESEKPGFMVETAITIFKEQGHEVKYVIRPWKRAQKEVIEGLIHGLIASTPQNSIGLNLEYPRIEQARMNNCFFTLKDSSWSFDGTDSLKKVKLGIIQGYNYGSEIQSYVDKNINNQWMIQNIAGEKALERNIKKLIKKRVTAVLEDKSVFRYTANQLGVFDQLRFAGNDGTAPESNNLYIAFTPLTVNQKSKNYAEILLRGMEQLRSTGKLRNILAKYGLSDWR
jgi:polar amino acid transport system substrate-binding protein